MSTPVEYWHAYHCGHYTRLSPHAHSGIAWCEVCRAYVSVIVQRIERAAAQPVGQERGE